MSKVVERDSLSNNRLLIPGPKSFLCGRCLTNLPGFLQSFATGRTFPLRRERIRRRKPSRNPSRPSRLRLRRALEESSGRLHRILFPGADRPIARPISSHTLPSSPVTLPAPLRFKPSCPPASARHTQPRSSVYSRARVLSVSHVASAKQIDPSSPSSHARDFRIVHGTARHVRARSNIATRHFGRFSAVGRGENREPGADARRTMDVQSRRESRREDEREKYESPESSISISVIHVYTWTEA